MAESSVNMKFTAQTADAQKRIEELEKKVASLNKQTKETNSASKQATDGVDGFSLSALKGTAAVAGLTVAVAATVAAAKECVKVYAEAERVQTRMTAVWQNVGKATGYSADQIKDYAEAIEKTTYFEAESVMSAAQLLAATEKLTDEGFKRALDASVDLAEALGTDVPNAASMMSRALSDPETGLRALRIAGINFTDAEKDQIKTLMEAKREWEAQEIVLTKVEAAYKGVAESVKATDAGKLETVATQLGNIKKNLGAAILDEIQPALNWVIKQLDKIEEWSKRNASNASIEQAMREGMSANDLVKNYSYEQLRNFRDYAMNNQIGGLYNGNSEAYGRGLALEAAVNMSAAQERGKKQTEYYSDYRISSPETPVVEDDKATNDVIEAQQTLADWLEKNRTLSAAAMAAYYDSQIAAATAWRESADASEEEKAMLDEIIASLQKKKKELHETTEGEETDLEKLNDYLKQNKNLSVAAQAAAIDAQIAEAEAWKTSNLVGEEQIRILDEIIARLKEQKGLLEDGSKQTKAMGGEWMSIASLVGDFASATTAFLTQMWDQEAAALEEEMDRQREAGELTVEEEEEKQKKINDLRKRSFYAEKANNIANALINGAIAVTQCLAQLGPIAGPIAAGLVTATTAMQVATIASQTYTPMAKGGVVTSATPILAGEAGPEAIIPLSEGRAQQYLGSTGGVTINITIEGNASTDDIYEAIERAQRTGLLPSWRYAE